MGETRNGTERGKDKERGKKEFDKRRIDWLDDREPTVSRSVPAWLNASEAEYASGMLIADRQSRAEPSSKRSRLRRRRITR